MSKIRLFGLGGFDEKGKNCLAVEINNEIILFNFGIKNLHFAKLGISYVIFDTNWIEKNLAKIKAIFIGTACQANIGALQYTNQLIANTTIYTSDVNKTFITNFYNEKTVTNKKNFVNFQINVIQPLKPIRFNSFDVVSFNITNSVPHSLGFVIRTSQGCIIIVDDFIYSGIVNDSFKSQLNEINNLTNKNNLLLIPAVGNIDKLANFTSPYHDLTAFFDSKMEQNIDHRLIIGCLDSDLFLIENIITCCIKYQRPVIFYNGTFVTIFNYLVKNSIIKIKGLWTVPLSKINELKNCVVVIVNNKQKLFANLLAIFNDQDKNIIINQDDKLIIATPTTAGYESTEAYIYDLAASKDVEYFRIPKETLTMQACSQDHLLLLTNLKPKFVIPWQGLYFNFIKYENLLKQYFKNDLNIEILYNGQGLEFENQKITKRFNAKIEDQFITNIGLCQIPDIIFQERKMMEENGIVFANIIMRKNQFNKMEVDIFDISSFGVLFEQDVYQKEIQTIKQNIIELVNVSYQKDDFNSKDLKNSIKKMLTKMYEKYSLKTPLVLTTIIDK